MNNTNMNSSLAELINITDICKQNINCLTVIYFSIAVIFIISFILVGTFFVFLTIIRDCLECRSYQNSLDTTAQFFPDPEYNMMRQSSAPPSYESQLNII
jgi:hypothetical protein